MIGTARRKIDKKRVASEMNIDNPDNPAVVATCQHYCQPGNGTDTRTRPDVVLSLERGN